MSDTKNELNDIILNKGGSELGGMKKILLAVATFAVLLIVVIVIMGSFSDDSKGVQTPQDESGQKVLPPEPDTAPIDEGPQLFKPAVITQDSNNTPIEATPVMPTQDELTIQEEEPTVIDDAYEPQEQPVQPKPKPKPIPKPLPKPAPQPQTTQKSSTPSNGDVILGRYYIQVGSFTRAPNSSLLKKIDALGYNYTTQRTSINSKPLTKLLIGPYSGYSDAKNTLPNVRANIEKNAFIYKAH